MCREHHIRRINVGIFTEICGVTPSYLFQNPVIRRWGKIRIVRVALRSLLGKVRRSVLFLSVNLGGGLDVQVGLRRFAIFTVGELPKNMLDGVTVVIERE